MPAVQDLSQPSLLSFATLNFVARGIIGGTLMGLANLVPGISGGTMLLAVGVYPQFIDAIADATSLRFRSRSLVLLAAVGLAAVLSIAIFAGPVVSLVLNHRWVMYSLFIGLTLGGAPLLWRLVRPFHFASGASFVAGLLGMAVVGIMQAQGAAGGSQAEPSMLLLFFAGALGASAMILPGISGGYLLLVLGCYVPILEGIDRFKEAAKAVDVPGLTEVVLQVVLPVGVGVALGVIGVSHLVKALLTKYEKATLGFLLGLLVGAVIGLWPFQELVPLDQVTMVKHQTVALMDGVLTYVSSGEAVKAKDYPAQLVLPSVAQALGALALIALGFMVTTLLARMSPESR